MLYVIVFMFFFIKKTNSQNQTNLNSNTYIFENSQKKKIDSTINYYSKNQKSIWLNLLPSFNYDLQNQTFNVGISLNSLAQFYQQKQRNKIEIAKLQQVLITKLNNNLDKLNLEIEKFYFQYQNLQSKLEIFKIDFNLFLITQGKYNNSEITTEQYFKLKKSYLTNKKSLDNEFFKLKYSAQKIKLKSKNQKFLDTIFVLKNQINKYKTTHKTEMLKE